MRYRIITETFKTHRDACNFFASHPDLIHSNARCVGKEVKVGTRAQVDIILKARDEYFLVEVKSPYGGTSRAKRQLLRYMRIYGYIQDNLRGAIVLCSKWDTRIYIFKDREEIEKFTYIPGTNFYTKQDIVRYKEICKKKLKGGISDKKRTFF